MRRAAAALLILAGVASGPGPPLTGVLALGTGQTVFVVRAGGTGGHALLAGDYPAYSRSGELAYTLDGVWVARPDGTRRRHIVPRFAEYLTYANPAWSPDGRWIAYVRVDNGHETSELWLVRADGSRLHGLTIVHVAQTPAWSPDGRWIAYVGDGGLSEVRADGSARRTLLRRNVTTPVWSPDGRTIAVEEAHGSTMTIELLDVASLRLRRIDHYAGQPGPLAFSPDGHWVAFATQRADAGGAFVQIRAVDVDSGARRLIARSFVQHLDGLAWR